eukprot:7203112-Ditylum_brightwellii.AAC.1
MKNGNATHCPVNPSVMVGGSLPLAESKKRGISGGTSHKHDNANCNKTSPSRVGPFLTGSDPERIAMDGGIAQLHHDVLLLVVDSWLC